MSEALNFSILTHIQSLASAADEAAAEQLEIAAQCLAEVWGMDASDDGEAARLNPSGRSLTEVFEAGAAESISQGKSISHDLADKLAKFIHDLSKKGFFNGVSICDRKIAGGAGDLRAFVGRSNRPG
eukprot:SAG11_NODE_4180_length_2025_cov_44.048806_1_plen_127_part_00